MEIKFSLLSLLQLNLGLRITEISSLVPFWIFLLMPQFRGSKAPPKKCLFRRQEEAWSPGASQGNGLLGQALGQTLGHKKHLPPAEERPEGRELLSRLQDRKPHSVLLAVGVADHQDLRRLRIKVSIGIGRFLGNDFFFDDATFLKYKT